MTSSKRKLGGLEASAPLSSASTGASGTIDQRTSRAGPAPPVKRNAFTLW
ncbi:hypothetical protein WME91_03445 [Sorangium sp. So ce269]